MGGREQNSPIYISRIIPGGVADRYVATQGSKNAKSGFLGHEDLFLCADWLRAMFDKSTDHGNDVMVVQFVFLFLLCEIFAVKLLIFAVKPAVCGFSWVLNILVSFLWPIRVQGK